MDTMENNRRRMVELLGRLATLDGGRFVFFCPLHHTETPSGASTVGWGD